MNYCKKCDSFLESKVEAKTGFCPACVDAIKRGEKQTKDIKSGKLKIEKSSKGKVLKKGE